MSPQLIVGVLANAAHDVNGVPRFGTADEAGGVALIRNRSRVLNVVLKRHHKEARPDVIRPMRPRDPLISVEVFELFTVWTLTVSLVVISKQHEARYPQGLPTASNAAATWLAENCRRPRGDVRLVSLALSPHVVRLYVPFGDHSATRPLASTYGL